MTDEQKKIIDSMTQLQLCRKWRFALAGDPLFQGDTGDYFAKRLKEMGGMTPEISKEIGWR